MGFFDSIGSFFSMITNFLEMAFNGLIQFIEVVVMAFTLPPILSGYICPILYSSMIAFISIYVVKLIVGRN